MLAHEYLDIKETGQTWATPALLKPAAAANASQSIWGFSCMCWKICTIKATSLGDAVGVVWSAMLDVSEVG